MLVLSRKLSQQIMIGSDIRITVVKIERNQVRIGIQAPDEVSILRAELIDNYLDPEPEDDFEPAFGSQTRILSV